MDITLVLAVFVLVASSVLLIGILVSSQHGRLAQRLYGLTEQHDIASPYHDVVGGLTGKVIPKLAVPLLPQSQEDQDRLKVRLVQAGFYSVHAMPVFLGIKMTLIVLPLVAGIALGLSGLVSLSVGLFCGAVGGATGQLSSDILLRYQKRRRQRELQRALPDALDMVVICINAGLSLPAALLRVAKELRLAHPRLGAELAIVNRSSEIGQTMPESLRQFAARFDLEQLRYLATIVAESERFGTSIGPALRVYADDLREQRRQRAEEAARRASVTIIFPTAVCILPVIFIVVLAPSLIRVTQALRDFMP